MTEQWNKDYLKQAVTEEIALAKLHPQWRRTFKAPAELSQDAPLVYAARTSTIYSGANSPRLVLSTRISPVPPLWRRTWLAAGELSTYLGLSIRHDTEERTVSVGVGSGRRNVTEAYADHPDADAATMAAIVRAAIQRLTELRDAH